jgi:hypothetical protein
MKAEITPIEEIIQVIRSLNTTEPVTSDNAYMASRQMHHLLYPMKPLQKLQHNVEHCRELYLLITQQSAKAKINVHALPTELVLVGESANPTKHHMLTINYNGSVDYTIDNSRAVVNCFQVADKIRALGYDAMGYTAKGGELHG